MPRRARRGAQAGAAIRSCRAAPHPIAGPAGDRPAASRPPALPRGPATTACHGAVIRVSCPAFSDRAGVNAVSDIVLEGVSKRWGETAAVDRVSLRVPAGSFVVLLGPSGCGKSTTLRLIAGLEAASEGRIHIGGQDVTDLPPAKRGVSMVFQSYALFPHLSVAENIVFGLKVRSVPRDERDRRLNRAAALLGLSQLLERKPSQLSGGQQQRVALGRAIVAETPVCLMDEPLSNLDAQLRQEMRREIRSLQRQLGITLVYVTHDQVEAMTMADRIVVLNAGRIEQVGSPLELYNHPANLFVAGFIGSPKMNLVGGAPAKALGAATIGIRPEHLHAGRDGGTWRGKVSVAEHVGSDTFLYVHVDGAGEMTVRAPGEVGIEPGDAVGLTPEQGRIHRFGEDGRALSA
ncbi:MAG: ABC transporter ATP-binding protein [Alphaproteobacteria bacterium]|nr:ABC transporter ATP-binding protein [Alphaproteobacteria bacterium]